MRLRFVGQYTGGRGAITLDGVTFTEREPEDVAADSILLRHPEFEIVGDDAPVVDGAPDVVAPRRRGRPRK